MAQQLASNARAEGVGEFIGAVRRTLTGSRRRPRTDRDSAPAAPSTSAPRTPFKAMISPHRRVAFRSVPLERIKEVKYAAGATVNDVVMAACRRCLRTYLADHGELPAESLVAMVPVWSGTQRCAHLLPYRPAAPRG